MTEKEFNHIILPLAKNIYSYALTLTTDRSEAADISQDVMVKLWDTRKELKKIKNLKAWVLKITHNLCLDRLKKQKPAYDDEQVIRNGGYDKDPLEEIEMKNTAAIIRKIIDTLPPNQKEVMILREIEELEVDEIEQITGLTPNHIQVLLSRGRSKVKEIVEKLGIRD